MNKLLTKVAKLVLGLSLAAGVGVAVGSQSRASRVDAGSGTLNMTVAGSNSNGTLTAVVAKASGSNAPITDGGSSYGVRLYANNTMVVSCSENITSLTIPWTKNSNKAFATVTASTGTYSHPSGAGNGTWSGSAKSITFTVGSSGQIQLKSISYTVEDAASWSVTYDGNGAKTGTVPTDATTYTSSSNTVTVAGNTGSLARPGYTFVGWTTDQANAGTVYGPGTGNTTYTISATTTFYAKWELQSGYVAGHINFGSASGSTPINGSSVNGTDSNSQSWAITVSGTTSFTQSSSYSQVGKSAEPATSIVMSATFSKKMVFDTIDVKFGGFSGTAGSVEINVDSQSAGTGSLDADNDVVIESTTSETGNAVSIEVSSIDKGVKVYYISYVAHEHVSANDKTITTSTNGLTLSGITTVESGDSAEITLVTAQKKKFTNLVVTGAGTEGDNWELVNGNTVYILEVTADVTINATIVDAEIVSLSVTGQKTSFSTNESFTFGGTVTGTYDDNAATHAVDTLVENTDYTVDSSDFVQGTIGTYSIEIVYSQSVTLSYNVTVAQVDVYSLFTGDLEDGHYVIVYDGAAMKAEISSDRFTYESVVISNDSITNPSSSIIWSIEQDGDYWTIYNESTSKYAASTGAASKGRLDDSISDNALWSASGSSTYDFSNKKNVANGVNSTLRKNSTYGFACYSTQTGGSLSLYKLPEAQKTISDTRLTTSGGSITADVGADHWTVSGFVFEVQYQGESSWNAVSPTYTVTESVPTSYNDVGEYPVHFKVTYKGNDYHTNTSFTATVTDDMTPISSFYDGTINVSSTATSQKYTYRGTVIAIEDHTYYIQQGNYGIMIYGGSTAPATGMKIGDLVSVTSKIINYNNYVVESNSITTVDGATCTILGDGVLPAAPIVTTAAQFNAANQSTRITFDGLSRTDSGATITWIQEWEQGSSGKNGLAKVQDSGGTTLWLYVSRFLDAATGAAVVSKIEEIGADDTFDLFQGVKAINTTNYSTSGLTDYPAQGTAYLSITNANQITIHAANADPIQDWIDAYLFMDDAEFEGNGTGKCLSQNYYVNAKAGLRAVEQEHSGSIAAFQANSEGLYTAALARYSAWAAACHDGAPFDGNATIVTSSSRVALNNIISDNTNTVAIIVVISMVSVTAIGGYFFLKKRREQN